MDLPESASIYRGKAVISGVLGPAGMGSQQGEAVVAAAVIFIMGLCPVQQLSQQVYHKTYNQYWLGKFQIDQYIT